MAGQNIIREQMYPKLVDIKISINYPKVEANTFKIKYELFDFYIMYGTPPPHYH